jgi:hypothetical protein
VKTKTEEEILAKHLKCKVDELFHYGFVPAVLNAMRELSNKRESDLFDWLESEDLITDDLGKISDEYDNFKDSKTL